MYSINVDIIIKSGTPKILAPTIHYVKRRGANFLFFVDPFAEKVFHISQRKSEFFKLTLGRDF